MIGQEPTFGFLLWEVGLVTSHTTKPSPRTLTDGDFASYVEFSTTPDKAVRPEGIHASFIAADAIVTQHHRSVAGWFVSLLTACVLSCLAYFALINERIALGGKNGISEYEGWTAAAVAFLLLALAMITVWRLARNTRFSRKFAGALLSIWLVLLVTYMISLQ